MHATYTALEYARVRASHVCPTCHQAKSEGLLLCWTCYRAFDARNGLPAFVADILYDTEVRLDTFAQAADRVALQLMPASSTLHTPAIVATLAAVLGIHVTDAAGLVTDAAVYIGAALWFVAALALYRWAFPPIHQEN